MELLKSESLTINKYKIFYSLQGMKYPFLMYVTIKESTKAKALELAQQLHPSYIFKSKDEDIIEMGKPLPPSKLERLTAWRKGKIQEAKSDRQRQPSANYQFEVTYDGQTMIVETTRTGRLQKSIRGFNQFDQLMQDIYKNYGREDVRMELKNN